MSSRNSYLNIEERGNAPIIYQTLRQARKRVLEKNTGFRQIESDSMAVLRGAGFKPEYFSIRQSLNLTEAHEYEPGLSILVAAWLGNARLIDNIQIDRNDSE